MKFILAVLLLFMFVSAGAQSFGISEKRARLEDVNLKDSAVQKKWFISSSNSIGMGFMGYSGGSATYIAAHTGIQLNRSLNRNWTAFAGLSLSPTYFINNQLHFAINDKAFSNSFMAGNPSRFSINPAVYGGLSYTNDERTFQISGSISVERRPYDMFWMQQHGGLPHQNIHPNKR